MEHSRNLSGLYVNSVGENALGISASHCADEAAVLVDDEPSEKVVFRFISDLVSSLGIM